jgi:tetratricopeptide (TPR) repeat protein
MAESYSDSPGRVEKSAASVRLDGWKDIAAYLGKAERTVKRWEADRGLPIHRVPGGAKASVYAYREELNQWLKSSSAADADPVEAVPGLAPEEAPAPTEVAQETVAYAEILTNSYPTASISQVPKLKWTTALFAVAATAVTLIVVLSSATGVFLPERIRAAFARKSPDAPYRSTPVSEAEKNLSREYYLKGRYEWNQRTPVSLNRALDLFTQAIVHDPGCAQAYAGLADTYDLLWEYSTMPQNDAFPRAVAAARKAVELDDSLAEAHRSLAFAEMYGTWDFYGAEKEFRRAIELDPKDPQARRWYANAFAVPGRFEESLEQINKAQELDPSSNATLADKGALLASAGRTQEAIDLLREVERSAPDFRSPHFYLMRISLAIGDYPTYLSEGEKAAESVNDPVLKDLIAAARSGYERGGGRGLLESLYAKQKEYYEAGKLYGTLLAKTCVLLGRKQEALQLLEVAYSRHEIDMLSCLSHPDLLTLKDEPRYKALVEKIHFPMHPVDSRPAETTGSDYPRLAIVADPH